MGFQSSAIFGLIGTQQLPPRIDFTYVDVNCLLHRILNSSDSGAKGPWQRQALVRRLCTELTESIEAIYDASTVPCKALVLCFDGPAPLAKLARQRQRRRDAFMNNSANRNTAVAINAITPGVRYLAELESMLMEEMKRQGQVNVVCIGAGIPGEGDAKMIVALRYFQRQCPNCVHLLVGDDGDLLLAGMIAGANVFWVKRKGNGAFNICLRDALRMAAFAVLVERSSLMAIPERDQIRLRARRKELGTTVDGMLSYNELDVAEICRTVMQKLAERLDAMPEDAKEADVAPLRELFKTKVDQQRLPQRLSSLYESLRQMVQGDIQTAISRSKGSDDKKIQQGQKDYLQYVQSARTKCVQLDNRCAVGIERFLGSFPLCEASMRYQAVDIVAALLLLGTDYTPELHEVDGQKILMALAKLYKAKGSRAHLVEMVDGKLQFQTENLEMLLFNVPMQPSENEGEAPSVPDPQHGRKVLEGVLLALHCKATGVWLDWSYTCNTDKRVSVQDLQQAITQPCEPIITPQTPFPPLTPDECTVLMLPVEAAELVAPQLGHLLSTIPDAPDAQFIEELKATGAIRDAALARRDSVVRETVFVTTVPGMEATPFPERLEDAILPFELPSQHEDRDVSEAENVWNAEFFGSPDFGSGQSSRKSPAAPVPKAVSQNKPPKKDSQTITADIRTLVNDALLVSTTGLLLAMKPHGVWPVSTFVAKPLDAGDALKGFEDSLMFVTANGEACVRRRRPVSEEHLLAATLTLKSCPVLKEDKVEAVLRDLFGHMHSPNETERAQRYWCEDTMDYVLQMRHSRTNNAVALQRIELLVEQLQIQILFSHSQVLEAEMQTFAEEIKHYVCITQPFMEEIEKRLHPSQLPRDRTLLSRIDPGDGSWNLLTFGFAGPPPAGSLRFSSARCFVWKDARSWRVALRRPVEIECFAETEATLSSIPNVDANRVLLSLFGHHCLQQAELLTALTMAQVLNGVANKLAKHLAKADGPADQALLIVRDLLLRQARFPHLAIASHEILARAAAI